MDFNPDVLYKTLIDDLNINPAMTPTEMSVDQAAKYSLANSILKKYTGGKSSDLLANRAIDGFKSSNTHCSEYNIPQSGVVYDILCQARELIHAAFYDQQGQQTEFHFANIANNGKTGPGSSIGTDRTDFLGKMFEGNMSVTDLSLYKAYVNTLTGRWLEAEKLRSSNFETLVVESSNLTTVPKNAETNRTICTEASLNMFFQLGAGAIIEGLLKRHHSIDLSQQPDINKRMARIGSLTGEFATIDLKSASDTISYKLCEFLLPRGVLGLLDLFRSKSTMHSRRKIELHMISSMGNGFTFPLQTMIFASLVCATYMSLGIKPVRRLRRNYSVFGDDIVVLSEAFDAVCLTLNGAGFIVNDQKSFSTGAFRESCGGDYFQGHDVRGVYLKEVTNEQDAYSAFNRILRWSCNHGIDLSNTLLYVKGLADFRPVPLHAGSTEGHHTHSYFLQEPKFDRNGSRVYHPTVPIARKIKLCKYMYAMSDKPFHGRFIAFMGGYIRSDGIGVRDIRPRFKVVKRVTPCWDYCADAGLTSRDYFARLISVL